MYFTSELPILYGEFVDRNRNVMVDCNDEVLSGRVQTIKESELKPTSEIVKLEEDVVEEAILALNNKREELISYKARCGRFCDRIDNCIAEVCNKFLYPFLYTQSDKILLIRKTLLCYDR